jgi:hypothetical protein
LNFLSALSAEERSDHSKVDEPFEFISDGGKSWLETLSEQPKNAAHFIDAKTGWRVGDSGVILKTTTGWHP